MLKQIGGFFVGLLEGLWDMVTGIGALFRDLFLLATGDEETRARYQLLIEMFKLDFWGTTGAVLQALVEPIVDDWQVGNYGEAVGRATFELLPAIIAFFTGGAGLVGYLSKTGKLSALLKVVKLERLLKVMKVSDLLKAGVKLDELIAAGAKIDDLLNAGVKVDDLLAAGVKVGDLLNAGVKVDDLLAAGIKVNTLVRNGVTLDELATSGPAFTRALDDLTAITSQIKDIPGGKSMARKTQDHLQDVNDALAKGDIAKARGSFNNLIGNVREAEVALTIQEQGGTVVQIDIKPKNELGQVLTDIDVISRESGTLVYNQVKSGNVLDVTPGTMSEDWKRFVRQTERTVDALERSGGGKIVYYVDNISSDARRLLEELARTRGVVIEIRLTA